MGSPEDYMCTLDEVSLKKAREELNEDPADRMNAVEAFRNLIKTRAPHIRCSMDATFLLRFLRIAKFSQLEALTRLEKYLTMFNVMPESLRNIDLSNPRIQAFLDTGLIKIILRVGAVFVLLLPASVEWERYMCLLGYNEEGQMVNYYNLGAFEPKSKKYDKNDMFAAIIGLSLYQSTCERTAVNRITAFFDLTEFQMKHQLFWKIDDLKRFADLMNGAFTNRWKKFYFYNSNPIFRVLYDLALPFMKQKIRDRMILGGNNLESYYDKKIPKHLFPSEYQPDDYTGPSNGSIKDLVKKFKEDILTPEVVETVKYLTSDAFRLDESKRPKNDVPLQTFRKLNVD